MAGNTMYHAIYKWDTNRVQCYDDASRMWTHDLYFFVFNIQTVLKLSGVCVIESLFLQNCLLY